MVSGRIGVITFDWYPFEPRARRLAETASSAGYDVDVICLRRPGEKARDVCNGVRLYRLPVKRHYGGSLSQLTLSWCCFLVLSAMMITRLHLRERYDVVHVHTIPDFLVFATCFLKLMGVKVILDVQDVTPELLGTKCKGRWRKALMRLAIWQERLSTALADHVLTVGWPFEELLLSRGVPAEKISIILNSAYPPFFPPAKRPLLPTEEPFDPVRPFILMYHGTIAERYGLDTAIRAVALVCDVVPNVRLEIKGMGDFLPQLQALVAELHLSDHVRFLPPSLDDIADFIAHGDVGVIPSRDNAFMELLLPTKAYEFAWMLRPMIASDIRAIRSMFRPESVVFCNPTSPRSFADAIIDLYQHPEKRTRMILHAQEDYEPYRWEAMTERYIQLLISLQAKYVVEEYRMTVE